MERLSRRIRDLLLRGIMEDLPKGKGRATKGGQPEIARLPTGISTKLKDLVLVRMADGVADERRVSGKPKDEQCVGLERTGCFTYVWTTERWCPQMIVRKLAMTLTLTLTLAIIRKLATSVVKSTLVKSSDLQPT